MDPDPHSEKLLDPDPHKMYADPQPWLVPTFLEFDQFIAITGLFYVSTVLL